MCSGELVAVNDATFHDERYLLQGGYILEGIMSDGDQVRKVARRNAANHFGMADENGGLSGSRLNRLHRTHSYLNEVFEILAIFSVRKNAGIGSVGDLNAGGNGFTQ